jgi:hypothetical protein
MTVIAEFESEETAEDCLQWLKAKWPKTFMIEDSIIRVNHRLGLSLLHEWGSNFVAQIVHEAYCFNAGYAAAKARYLHCTRP